MMNIVKDLAIFTFVWSIADTLSGFGCIFLIVCCKLWLNVKTLLQ